MRSDRGNEVMSMHLDQKNTFRGECWSWLPNLCDGHGIHHPISFIVLVLQCGEGPLLCVLRSSRAVRGCWLARRGGMLLWRRLADVAHGEGLRERSKSPAYRKIWADTRLCCARRDA